MRFLSFCLAISLIGCAGSGGPTPQEVLDRTIYSYNQHMRWKRFEKASQFVDVPLREKFMKIFEDADETLSIDDLEVREVNYEGESKALITIDVKFFQLPSVTLQKAKWVQTWEKRGGDWWLVANASGPFFKDKNKDDAASKPTMAPMDTNLR